LIPNIFYISQLLLFIIYFCPTPSIIDLGSV